MIGFTFNDGGRAAAGYKGTAGDCVVRAVSIATGQAYHEVYAALQRECAKERLTAGRKRSHPNRGVHKATVRRFIKNLGWTWVPTMQVGSGAKVHLRSDELPMGRIIVNLSRHVAAVIDGVLHDNHCDDREGTRCVYGYWLAPGVAA